MEVNDREWSQGHFFRFYLQFLSAIACSRGLMISSEINPHKSDRKLTHISTHTDRSLIIISYHYIGCVRCEVYEITSIKFILLYMRYLINKREHFMEFGGVFSIWSTIQTQKSISLLSRTENYSIKMLAFVEGYFEWYL